MLAAKKNLQMPKSETIDRSVRPSDAKILQQKDVFQKSCLSKMKLLKNNKNELQASIRFGSTLGRSLN